MNTETMIAIISLITFIALAFYVLFGGADYGAGILEIFRRHDDHAEQEKIITSAIGPVWEVNHIWLILITVILFNGFPPLYLALTTYLHIPMVAVLIGLVIRGVAFTYRHYDVFAEQPTRFYTWAFSLSSLWTSVWLGVIFGALIFGGIDPDSKDVWALYMAPWLNTFSWSIGFFVASLFAYLASCFLVGESENQKMKSFFVRRAVVANIAVVVTGGIALVVGLRDGVPLSENFFSSPMALACMGVATVFWVAQLYIGRFMRRNWGFVLSRVLAAGQTICILLGFVFAQKATLVVTKAGPLTFANTAAPDATLFQLLVALIVGVLLILPSIAILFWIFKFKRTDIKS